MLSWSVGSSDAGWKALEASSDADGDGTHSESELLVLAKSALPNLDEELLQSMLDACM